MPTNILQKAQFIFGYFACSPWKPPTKTFGTMHTVYKYFIMNWAFQLVNTEKLTMKINQYSKPKNS